MDFEKLEYILFEKASVFMRKEGRNDYRNDLVSSISGKNIDGIYHIYGTVHDKFKTRSFNTHLKLNLKLNKVIGTKCSCEDFREGYRHNTCYMCRHVVASSYKFLTAINRKNSKSKTTSNTNSESKKVLELECKLVYKVEKDNEYYECDFKIINTQKFPINDLSNFISGIKLDRKILIHRSFTYNSKIYEFKDIDKNLISFFTNFKEDDGFIIRGNKLAFKKDKLELFLKLIENKNIIFKYNFLEYKVNVLNNKMPLTFTIKDKDNKLILTTLKELPISILKDKVFLYKGNIYILSDDYLKIYLPLYNVFKNQKEIIYKKDLIVYNKLIKQLTVLTDDIHISQSVKDYILLQTKPTLFIYKDIENIYSQISINYGDFKINILEENNNKLNSFRDFNFEDKTIMTLENFKFIKATEKMLYIGDDSEFLDILKGTSNIYKYFNITFSDNIKNIVIYNSDYLKMSINDTGDSFNLKYSLGDISIRELNSAYEAYTNHESYYKLNDNSFIDLTDSEIVNFFSTVYELDLTLSSFEVEFEKNKIMYLKDKFNNINFINKDIILDDLEYKIKWIREDNHGFLQNLNATLRDYQIEGVNFFRTLSALNLGGILADDMGLGKTIQTIAFLLSQKGKTAIIITPTSLLYNWKSEFDKFAKTINVGLAYGDKQKREKVILNADEYDVILTTYGSIKNDLFMYDNKVFDFCIIDEAQMIKNDRAKITTTVKSVRSNVRFALTGTPMENNLKELWSIFDFIMPEYLYSKNVFEKKILQNKEDGVKILKLMTSNFILRRTKSDVLKELPDKIEKKYLVEMTTSQKVIYNNFIKDVKLQLKKGNEIEIFSYLTKLRQICLDPSILIDEYKGGSGKIKVALELIDKNIINNNKILLFSQFTSVLDILGKTLSDNNIKYYHLDGSTNVKDRLKMVDEFNVNDDIKVFLISLKAGGVGLNLTGANVVIHFDPWWNPSVENQATDRAHRIGQKKVVEVIKLIAKNSIEEKIVAMQEDKNELISQLLDGDFTNNIMSKRIVTKQDIITLFDS